MNQQRAAEQGEEPIQSLPGLNELDPVILHYPCCGFEHFWRKYKTLGNFTDKWFNEVDIARSGNTFHLEARDVVLGNDRAAALDFYKRRVVISDEERIGQLLDNGLCCLVHEPSRLISTC